MFAASVAASLWTGITISTAGARASRSEPDRTGTSGTVTFEVRVSIAIATEYPEPG